MPAKLACHASIHQITLLHSPTDVQPSGYLQLSLVHGHLHNHRVDLGQKQRLTVA